MRSNPKLRRGLLLAGAALAAAAAILVVAAVIPPVLADTYERAAPERAAMAFRVNAGLNALCAVACLALAFAARSRTARSTAGLFVVGIVALLLGFALLDAGGAFGAHGEAMRTARGGMFVGAAADGLAGALILLAAFVVRPLKRD